MNELKLTIELVPKPLWYSNLRKELPKADWDKLRKEAYRNAGYCCEICGGKGPKWPVECHEKWEYNDDAGIQRLVGLQALCPDCHMCKHLGYAQTQGKLEQAIAHLMQINGISEFALDAYVGEIWHTWEEPSQEEWIQDLTWLKSKGIAYKHREGRI